MSDAATRTAEPEPHPKKVLKRAIELVREAELLSKKRGAKVSTEARDEVNRLIESTKALIPTRRNKVALEGKPLLKSTIELDAALGKHYGAWRKSQLRELVEAIAWALGLALVIRCFLFEAFSIPSSSMYPTLHIGDHLFVNKAAMGLYWPFSAKRAIEWNQPDRGDVIVFVYRFPGDHLDGEDFIKRVVAVEGDLVRLENDRLILNNVPVQTEVVERKLCDMFNSRDYDETPSGQCPCVVQRETIGDESWTSQHLLPGCGGRDELNGTWPLEFAPRARYMGARSGGLGEPNPDWPNVRVPAGHVFVMGDNRDASEDGRFWGFVPYERIKGTAFVIFLPFSRIFTWLD
jgi:signal peptidase I